MAEPERTNTVQEEERSRRVRWRQEIDQYSEELADIADKTLSAARMTDLKRTMRMAQLANFLGVALEASSVAAVRNWVSYQMGRRETNLAWKQSHFGDAVLQDLKTIGGYAQQIVRDVYPSEASFTDEKARQLHERRLKREVQKTHIALVRLYIGYLRRWFVARGGQS
jgi:hypothetical protein